MGPCQGGFCTFRAAGIVAERAVRTGGRPTGEASVEAEAGVELAPDRVLIEFLAERFRGTRPIAWGRQLQELWVTAGLYGGSTGIDSLLPRTDEDPAAATVDGADGHG